MYLNLVFKPIESDWHAIDYRKIAPGNDVVISERRSE